MSLLSRMAANPSRRRSSRLRSQTQQPRDDEVEDDLVIAGPSATPTCIDLTDDNAEDVIDLTSPHGQRAALIDLPVVVLTPTNLVGPLRARTGSGRQGRHRSSLIRRRRRSALTLRPTEFVPISDDSDNDLPDIAVQETAAPSGSEPAANSSILQSPEGIKITCPICMESAQEIRRRNRSLVSTNCGHVFCNVCIRGVLSTRSQCPTCRKKLTPRSVHPLFL